MFIAHAPVSYLANEAILGKRIKNLKPAQEIFVTFWSLFCGILPDFDLFLLMVLGRPTFTHHNFVTHTFIFWLIAYFLLAIILRILYQKFNKKTKDFLTIDFLKIFSLTFLVGTIFHLVGDIFVSGIMLFYPLSTKDFSLLQYTFPPSYFTGYYMSFYFAIELVFIVIFLYTISKKFFRKQKWNDFIFYILIGLSIVYLLFTTGMYSQTYNKGLLYDKNGNVSEDIDFDGISDTYDYDVNNDGINNIDEAIPSHLALSAEEIINSGKLAIPQKKTLNIIEKIIYEYGGINSYRIISQTYFENKLPIEPVLQNEVRKRIDNPSYNLKFDKTEELYTYFRNKEKLLTLNTSSAHLIPQGKIFFILDKDMNILNLGITLTNNYMGIVLPNDTRLTKHTLKEILTTYDMNSVLFKIQE